MPETEPRIIAETEAFLIVFKPRSMHSAPLAEGEEHTLLAWCGRLHPSVLSVRGRKEIERGLLHRLDRDTEGLVLLAKTQAAYDALNESQEQGLFLKEYAALCVGAVPPRLSAARFPFSIESGFRPFGPGRRAVKPVEVDGKGTPVAGKVKELALDRGRPYRTEVLSLVSVDSAAGPRTSALVRLARGFRHQVRCHLAWFGLPLVGDGLYGPGGDEALALSAVALSFPDPSNGKIVRYELPYAVASSSLSGGRS
jgi:23S rRNA pseudouridine1911/1915/1917 synthase